MALVYLSRGIWATLTRDPPPHSRIHLIPYTTHSPTHPHIPQHTHTLHTQPYRPHHGSSHTHNKRTNTLRYPRNTQPHAPQNIHHSLPHLPNNINYAQTHTPHNTHYKQLHAPHNTDYTQPLKPHRTYNTQSHTSHATHYPQPYMPYNAPYSHPHILHNSHYTPNTSTRGRYRHGCYNCGEYNRRQDSCRFDHRLKCELCNGLGHKQKLCHLYTK